ncbi:hypothetical protein LXL04_017623 [Taraxacum kok-saghyz]
MTYSSQSIPSASLKVASRLTPLLLLLAVSLFCDAGDRSTGKANLSRRSSYRRLICLLFPSSVSESSFSVAICSKRDVLELEEAIKIKDGEAESYISEIETIGQAYEDMQTQNQHLLQQVMERDDYNIKLVSESVKMKQTHTALISEKQILDKQLQQVNSAFESLKSRIAHSEEQMNACVTQALKMDRKKLDEELVELNMKVTELTLGSSEAAIQKLQDEIKECKSILKCRVCFDRPKEVVIVKCYHLFCNPCIQRNLEIRHRKCPGCGMAFGQNDVRFVEI